ncbi:MAG: RagB/SusD family nutrient uptake outer membrane protein [Ferruginibacter sp.]
MKKIYLFIAVFAFITITGCKKEYLNTKPSNGVTIEQIFGQLTSVYAALNGSVKEQFAYSTGSATGPHDAFGQKGYDLANDLMGNDMVVHSSGYGWFNTDYNYTEFQNPNVNRQCDLSWYLYYDLIRQANTILEYLDNVPDATQEQKDAIKGEALAIRGYCYFYLINYFQQSYKGNETKPGVPLKTVVSLDDVGRGTVQEIYDQMISDFTSAETLLDGKTRVDKSHIDVNVIRGFRARIALLQEDWASAASFAHSARQGYPLLTIGSGMQYTDIDAFSSVANPEWIWGSIIDESDATIYASFFSHIDINTGGYAALGARKKLQKHCTIR